jgi:hypothetical protein
MGYWVFTWSRKKKPMPDDTVARYIRALEWRRRVMWIDCQEDVDEYEARHIRAARIEAGLDSYQRDSE